MTIPCPFALRAWSSMADLRICRPLTDIVHRPEFRNSFEARPTADTVKTLMGDDKQDSASSGSARDADESNEKTIFTEFVGIGRPVQNAPHRRRPPCWPSWFSRRSSLCLSSMSSCPLFGPPSSPSTTLSTATSLA